MGLFFQIISTTTFLLLILTFHPVHLQDNTEATDVTEPSTTDSPVRGKHVPSSWHRLPPLKKELQVQPYESEDDQNDVKPTETESGSSYDPSGSGTAFGSMFIEEATEDPTQVPIFPNETMLESQNHQDSNGSVSDASVTESDSRNNDTVLEHVDEVEQDLTNATDITEVQTAPPAEEKNVTEASDVGSGEGITNKTEIIITAVPETTAQQSSTTAAVPVPETTEQESPEEPNMTEASTGETTISDPASTDRTNQSDKVAAPSDGTGERGFGSESEKRRSKSQWGAVLGTFVAIAVVGLVVYVILKKKHHKAFSHRKLEEDFPSDPVLRLDNSEPLDLNFGRAAYHNRGLQMDDIQMGPYPKH